jgi:HEAT repeat protein
MKRTLAAVAMFACFAAALWYYRTQHQARSAATPGRSPAAARNAEWLDRLYSRNPTEAAAASQQLTGLGAAALPVIEMVLQDQQSEAERLKAALKAAGILGKIASPLVPDVAEVLHEPALTTEAAVALSYMGPDAFEPLREALSSDDVVVRREALRSIGKLTDRAPLEARVVIPSSSSA